MTFFHNFLSKRRYGVPVLVAVNKFDSDTAAELEAVRAASLAAGRLQALINSNIPIPYHF